MTIYGPYPKPCSNEPCYKEVDVYSKLDFSNFRTSMARSYNDQIIRVNMVTV